MVEGRYSTETFLAATVHKFRVKWDNGESRVVRDMGSCISSGSGLLMQGR